MTNHQQMIPCQLVLVCTGTAPVTALAKSCDLPMKHQNGILVDDQLRTSVRDIYAVGDVAALRDPLTGKYAPRAQWNAAVLQGRAVAYAIAGQDKIEQFGVSWHATRLGDLSMLTIGNPLDWPESVVPLTEKRRGSYCRLSLVDDRLVGYLSLGSAQPDSLAIKRIIDEGLSVRDITKDLLNGEFDARRYFSGKRTYAVQRMITTGEMPTPLPPLPGIMGGERQTSPRTHSRPPVHSRLVESRPVPNTDALVRSVQPAVPPAAQGPRSGQATRSSQPLRTATSPQSSPPERSTGPAAHSSANPKGGLSSRSDKGIQSDLERATAGSVAPVGREEAAELIVRLPERQFIVPPNQDPNASNNGEHPSRSLWHYTNQHRAVKGKDNVQK